MAWTKKISRRERNLGRVNFYKMSNSEGKLKVLISRDIGQEAIEIVKLRKEIEVELLPHLVKYSC